MSPKIKMYLIYSGSFLALFVISWFILGLFLPDNNIWRKMGPIAIAFLLSPKPHVERTQTGTNYGLRVFFLKGIWPIK